MCAHKTDKSSNKLLSCRRETALLGGSVLAKSGRRYSADNIGLSSTVLQSYRNNAK